MESAENREQPPKVNQPESQDSESLSKIETIKLLNDSIDRLESTIKGISKNPAENLPSSDSINTLLNTTQELANSVAPTPETVVDKAIAEEIPAVSTIETTPVEKNPIPAAKIKSKPVVDASPQSKKTVAKKPKKSNRGLIVISMAAIALTLIILAWFRFPQIKAAVSPASETTEIANKIDENVINQDSETIDIPVVNPDLTVDGIAEDKLLSDIPSIEPEAEVVEPVVIPPDLTAPGRTKNLKIATVEPELIFTPEQSLIAALQSKLAEIIENYDSDLFNNVQVDLPKTSLLLELTDDWYEINESRQAKLANDILKRTRQLNFSKLELQDPTGTLVARSPVVGDRIIILQSSKDH